MSIKSLVADLTFKRRLIAKSTMEPLKIGKMDFIEKPAVLKSSLLELRIKPDIKTKHMFYKKEVKDESSNITSEDEENLVKDIKAVVIGASTGGPKALTYLVKRLPDRIKTPIFIVQHMPKGFTTSLSKRLDNESKVRVVEAEDGMVIQNNMIYLAPGDFHMIIDGIKIRLNKEDKLHGVRPAVDYLFNTAASIYRENLLGIILTGMGSDGSSGMENIKKMGGYNIAQNKESCVVYGMPGSAVSKGVVHRILSLEDISNNLNELIRVK